MGQIQGNITVKIIEDGTQRDILINEGDIFLLPPKTPHSPQRAANTVGLVMERKRLEHELDGFMWFCESCSSKLYEEFLPVKDIVKQLPPVFDRFYSSIDNRTCKNCGNIMQPPPPIIP